MSDDQKEIIQSDTKSISVPAESESKDVEPTENTALMFFLDMYTSAKISLSRFKQLHFNFFIFSV